MILLVALFIAAIVAMGFGLEYLSLTLFAAGLAAGWWSDRRDQQRRAARETHRRLVEELRRR